MTIITYTTIVFIVLFFFRETCNKGSLLQLKELLAERGFNFNCQDNPALVLKIESIMRNSLYNIGKFPK